MKVAVLSVVYPGVESYVSEFLKSLSNQTNKDFTLYIINDGLAEIETFLNTYDLKVNLKEVTGAPGFLRKTGIAWAQRDGVEVIVFADSDDYFPKNRIEIALDLLRDNDIVFNELMQIGVEIPKPIPMLGERFEEGEEITTQTIMSGNCMGLTNTALQSNMIPPSIHRIPDDIVAFDWDFFALCLHEGAKAVFTKQTCSYYRQHGNNAASLRSLLNTQIIEGVKIKRNHYKLLSSFYPNYSQSAKKYQELFELLEFDASLRQEFCRKVREQILHAPLWWESIKTFEELK